MIGVKKKCIGLIFGGESNEHEVSISSAKTVFQAFNSERNKQRFTVKAFYISKFGDWFDSDLSEKILVGEIENYKTKKQETFNQEKINFLDGIEFQNIDVWFPLLHGFNGEDGSIHGLIRFTKKPLVGCGIIGSALGMDKILMKTIFSNLELPQVNYLVIQNEDLNDKQIQNKIINEILKKLQFPVFVKPSNSGSSLGISKVKNESEILLALFATKNSNLIHSSSSSTTTNNGGDSVVFVFNNTCFLKLGHNIDDNVSVVASCIAS